MNRFLKNLSIHKGTIISIKENNKQIIFDCGCAGFYQIKLDDFIDNILAHNQTRCDYILYENDEKLALFIELKGKDLEKSFMQILSTSNFVENADKKYAAIIYKGGIPQAQTRIQRFKAKYSKNFIDIFIKTDILRLKFQNSQIVKID